MLISNCLQKQTSFQIFDSPGKLQVHLIEHSFAGCSEYQCYLCGSVFSMAHPLSQHMVTHSAEEKPYDCPFCDQRFFFRSELDNHVLSHQRPVSQSMPLPPPPLTRATPQTNFPPSPSPGPRVQQEVPAPKLQPEHKNGKDKNSGTHGSNGTAFPCPHCPKVFGSLSALQGHSHVHMTNKTHHCSRYK